MNVNLLSRETETRGETLGATMLSLASVTPADLTVRARAPDPLRGLAAALVKSAASGLLPG